MKSFRDIRVIPVVLVAIFGLVVLKVAGLVLEGGYVFDYQPNAKQASWAQEMLNYPGGPKKTDRRTDRKADKGDPADITGSTAAKKEEPPKPTAPVTEPAKPDGVVVFPDQSPRVSESERAILGLMQPEAAERLTVELARRAGGDNNKAAELPKIEGKMLNQKTNKHAALTSP